MHQCCSRDDAATPVAVRASNTRRMTTPRTWLSRCGAVIEWAIPLTTLALVPKCPACVAGYVLLFSGIGLSLPGAAAVRWALVALCIAAVVCLLLRTARRAFAHSRQLV